MRSRGSVVLKRIPRTPTVSILPGERVFHKLPDGTYEPATITLEAVVNNVDNPKYQWGRIVGGSFQPYSVAYSHMIASPVHAGVVAVKVTGDTYHSGRWRVTGAVQDRGQTIKSCRRFDFL